jgi:DNA-binding GntR family transcriptional regulator
MDHVGRAAVAVRASLMSAISDQYRPGDQLPSEPELAAAYSVSRSTVREALQSLENEGVVRRVHGLGTFVTQLQPRVSGALDVDLGVTEAVQAANQRLGVQVLRVEETAAPRDIAEQLALPPASRVLLIERIILANDRPAALAVDAIPARVAQAARTAYRDGSVYRHLERDCDVVLVGGVAHVSAVDADARMARLLRVDQGAALLRMEQVERSQEGDLVLYSLEHYVPSCFDLTVRRTRNASGAR